MGIVGNILDAEQAADEGLEIVARESPEDLPEGTKVPLREADPQMPGFRNPTGYSVEKTGGRVIYRDPFGNEIGRDAAIEGSKKAARTHDA